MIRGYPERSSVVAGETLTLRVSTSAPSFRVDFSRQGASLVGMGDPGGGSHPGQDSPHHPSDQDWGVDSQDSDGNPLAGWRGYDFRIPRGWPSGAYVAILTELDDAGSASGPPDDTTADGRDSKALFVVKSRSPGVRNSILYKLPLFTFHAYNTTGDPPLCLYNGSPTVSIRRPGGGTGGITNDLETYPDSYDSSSPRETFAHWDAQFIGWLESNGYGVDYCTDLDLHQDSASLGVYKLLLSVGHDEYWSAEMRQHTSAFTRSGGNVAFFSGNVAFKPVVFDDGSEFAFGYPALWYQMGEPENSLTGVSYRNAGGQWDGPRPNVVGYTVQHADDWVYEGTDLQDGDVFGDFYGGDVSDPAALVGYEADGAIFDRAQLGQGVAVVPTHEDSTPDSFVILGVADLTGWQDYDANGPATGNRAATMGYFVDDGTVFTAATSDWSRVLASGREPRVEAITRNVLNRLSA